MREIKFRAWDIRHKIMIPWNALKSISTNSIAKTLTEKRIFATNGNVVVARNIETGISRTDFVCQDLIEKDVDSTVIIYERNHDIWSDENLIKQQFTGLRDKCGVEIYEGDLVHCQCEPDESFIGITKFRDAFFECKTNDEFSEDALHYKPSCLTIVGNIYEDQDLLKSGE